MQTNQTSVITNRVFLNGDGDLVLHPIPEKPEKPEKRGTALLKMLNALDAEFVVRLEEYRAARRKHGFCKTFML